MDAPMKILIVEDHADTRKVLAMFLRHCGHHVIEAASVAEAMAKLDGQAVALLDFNLGDGVGTEVLERIKREGRPTRVAMVSASHKRDLDLMRDAGADAVFTKPLDMDAVRKWIAAGCDGGPA